MIYKLERRLHAGYIMRLHTPSYKHHKPAERMPCLFPHPALFASRPAFQNKTKPAAICSTLIIRQHHDLLRPRGSHEGPANPSVPVQRLRSQPRVPGWISGHRNQKRQCDRPACLAAKNPRSNAHLPLLRCFFRHSSANERVLHYDHQRAEKRSLECGSPSLVYRLL